MMFQQGAGNRPGCEFGELRSYMIAKLLWNPYINFDSVMNDFLKGYYGKAGSYIRKYIDIMTEGLLKSGAGLWIYDNPVAEMKNYLSPELMEKYNQIFDKAENSVRKEPEYLERVKEARLPLTYAMLEQAKVIGEGEKGIVKKTDGGYITNSKITALLEQFHQGCRKIGDVAVNEKNLMTDSASGPANIPISISHILPTKTGKATW